MTSTERARRAVPGASYGAVAKSFHWLIAALVLFQYPLAIYMDDFVERFSPEQFQLFNLHKSIGATILLLAVLRLAWRQISPPPPMPPAMPGWERAAAHGGHAMLYLLLFVQPLSGLLYGFASGFPTVLYFAVTVPSPLAADKELASLFATIHFFAAWSLLALVAIHVLAALRHHVLLKDEVLTRMLPGAR